MKEETVLSWMEDYWWITEPFALFTFQDQCYKIPFFVLEDMLNDLIKIQFPSQQEQEKRRMLSRWLNTWKTTWRPESVEWLKKILTDDMPAMKAYIFYEPDDRKPKLLDR